MFKQRHFEQNQVPEERLSERARRLHREAKGMPHGVARERLTRLARQAETGAQMSSWLRSSRSQLRK